MFTVSQRSLFDHREPVEKLAVKLPSNPTDTQSEAAARELPRSGTARRWVFDLLSNAGMKGATDEEMQFLLKMNPNTQRPRRKELVEMGWVFDTGARRKTASGSRAIVWGLCEEA